MKTGLVHIYFGEGKGKTTAAVGLAVRAAGSGMCVCFAQLMKPGRTSELDSLRALGVRVISGAQHKFSFDMTEEEKALVRTRNDAIVDEALLEPCDLLVLDEAIGAYRKGLVTREKIERLLEEKPDGLELVLTGRDPEPFMLERADYATEMVCRKHPYRAGIAARRGIEF